MKKSKKLTKQLCALIMTFIIISAVSVPIVSTATTSMTDFNFVVKIKQLPSTDYNNTLYRDTGKLRDSWSVYLEHSSETVSVRSVSRFYLGVENSNGVNAQGSDMYDIVETATARRFPAYSNASYKNVLLYARNDNYVSSGSGYTVSGTWSANTGKTPTY